MEQLRYTRWAKRLPVVLSKKEVFRLFAAIRNPKHRTALMTLYATGMRVSPGAAPWPFCLARASELFAALTGSG